MNIYVGNLPLDLTEEDLREAFAAFGEVETAKIITDKENGRARGFGFVGMPKKEERPNIRKRDYDLRFHRPCHPGYFLRLCRVQ